MCACVCLCVCVCVWRVGDLCHSNRWSVTRTGLISRRRGYAGLGRCSRLNSGGGGGLEAGATSAVIRHSRGAAAEVHGAQRGCETPRRSPSTSLSTAPSTSAYCMLMNDTTMADRIECAVVFPYAGRGFGAACGSGGTACWLVTRKLLARSPAPGVSRCP